MNRLKLFSFPQFVTAAAVVVLLLAFKGDKDALHKRIFFVNLTEIKDSGPVKKTIFDEVEFKDGKMFSEYLFDKFNYKWIRYRINKDTVYVDSTNTKVRRLDVEASHTDDETDQTVTINFTTVEWDLEGTVKITKKDKLKKYFDMTGFEKGGKPKKEKKKKNPNDTIPLFELKKE
ncbi:MAG: hypothetical protein KF900_03800 [Bacteroidetes bacterium]|nr:hypothetical protein [Bacteroidota bacterium]